MTTWEYRDLRSRVDEKSGVEPNWPVIAGIALCAGFWLAVCAAVGVF